MIKTFVVALILSSFAIAGAQELNVEVVPPGNRNSALPELPESTKKKFSPPYTDASIRPRADARLKETLGKVRKKNLHVVINKIGEMYGIDPVHILSAVAGEHVFNVDWADFGQSTAMAVGRWAVHFNSNAYNLSLKTVLQTWPFGSCPTYDDYISRKVDSYIYWTCVENYWNAHYRGRKPRGKVEVNEPLKGFVMSFFNPFKAGLTYGFGQMGPLTALKMSDTVYRFVSRLTPQEREQYFGQANIARMSLDDVSDIYGTLLNERLALLYVGASSYLSIQFYRKVAGFDISQNPGVVTTLYNLGREQEKAQKLKQANDKRLQQGQGPLMPAENYMGYYINNHIDVLRKALQP